MPTPADTDVTHAYSELAALRQATERGHWPQVRDQLTEIAQRGADEEARAAAVVAQTPGAARVLAIDSDSGDPLAEALWAYNQIIVGWEARSGKQAEYVERSEFETFHAHLKAAEPVLIRLCAQHPEWALPWILRLLTARGLELGQSEARRRFARLSEHTVGSFAGQQQLLQILLPKWSGSWDSAYAFARDCETTGVGTNGPAMVPIYHLERWLDDSGPAGTAYLTSGPVRDDLERSAHASVWHDDYDGGFAALTSHTAYAAAFALAGVQPKAAAHWHQLGRHVDDFIWRYVGTAQPVLTSRDAALNAMSAGDRG